MRNMKGAGVVDSVAMSITGHKTRSMYERSQDQEPRVQPGGRRGLLRPVPDGLIACAKDSLSGANVSAVAHDNPRYTVGYTLTLGGGGEAAAASASPSVRPADEGAPGGPAQVVWEVALVREAPKTGKILARLPKGRWVGGTTPYFMAPGGGTIDEAGVFCSLIDEATDARVAVLPPDDLPSLVAGRFANGFLHRLKYYLETRRPKGLAVLCSCAPGQLSWTSEADHCSVFGYYVALGWSGKAATWRRTGATPGASGTSPS